MDDLAVKRRKIIAQAAGIVGTMCAYTLFLYKRAGRKPPITYGPLSERDKIRMANLRFIFHNDDRHCVEQLRMRRAPFFHLCTLLRTRHLLKDTINSSVEEQVAMFLQVVGHNCRFRLIELNFRRSPETISRYFQEVLYAIGELRGEMIQPPSNEVHPKIANSQRFNPYFKDCIGAIDGTHVLARVPASMAPAFRGRKGVTTQNVMAAVDFDLKFTFVLAGWEGSAHDALILADALERDDGLKVPQGKFYLVDAGYAARPGFLPPYRGCRYHLKEYGGRNHPRDQRELFNLRHSSLRVTVERAFGALKNRFRILYNRPFHPYKTQVKLVLACCILHNWILMHGEYLNIPLENYTQMAVIFSAGQATGRYAMASSEPLGAPSDVVDSDGKADPISTFTNVGFSFDAGAEEAVDVGDNINTPPSTWTPPNAPKVAAAAASASEDTGKGSSSAAGSKRKRAMITEEETTLFTGMTNAVTELAGAVKETVHAEAHPGVYKAIMSLPGFTQDAKLAALEWLYDNKAQSIGFVQMTDEHRHAWMNRWIAKHYFNA